ncbi:MAG: DMT family transporter [Stagnimonas sp.]|nr:DMT family transporter [Stagnimonas sp.]
MPQTDNRRGIIAMLLAVVLFTLMDACLKLLSPHYPPIQTAALRGLASLPLVTVWVLSSGRAATLLRIRWRLHLFRGVLGIAMMASFSYALRTLPLATAYSLFFIAPLLITALSGPMLGETVGRNRWIAIACGLLGMLVVLRPTGAGLQLLPALAVLFAAAGYAFSAITVRILARTDSTQAMVFWLMLLLGGGAALVAAPHWVPIAPAHWWILAALGLCGTGGQIAITTAFSKGEASVIAPLEYSALAWALGLDLLLWQALPDGMTLLGAAIIVAAGIFLIRRETAPKAALPECSP